MVTQEKPHFVDALPEHRSHTIADNRWMDQLTAVMERPNCWAIIGRFEQLLPAARSVAELNDRKRWFGSQVVNVPPGEWNFQYRQVDDEHRVYARYVIKRG